MLEVHHLNNSRSQRVLWMLGELGVEYTIVAYQRDPKTMLGPPQARAIHPLGKFPVIRDAGRVIAESGAIIEYLVERYGRGRFAPPRETPEYERYRYWMHYAEGSLMTQVILKLYLGRVGEAANALLERVNDALQMHLAFVESSLDGAPYLTGGEFTAADVQMSFPLEVCRSQGLTRDLPGINALLQRLHERPACQAALNQGGPYAYAK